MLIDREWFAIHTTSQYGMVGNGMVWYGMVWYGIVWYGMQCFIMYSRVMLLYVISMVYHIHSCAGHIYTITSSEKATEESRCPECRLVTGGTHNHQSDGKTKPTEIDRTQPTVWSGNSSLVLFDGL